MKNALSLYRYIYKVVIMSLAKHYNIPTIYIDSKNKYNNYLQELSIIGLDTEYNDNKIVSTVQIYDGKACVVFNIYEIRQNDEDEYENVKIFLKDIFEDNNILKLGVGIKYDCSCIYKTFGIITESYCDIGNVHIKHTGDLKSNLQYITNIYCNFVISKEKHVQCGEWDVLELSEEQLIYAQNDGIASYMCGINMYNKYKLENETIQEFYKSASSYKQKIIQSQINMYEKYKSENETIQEFYKSASSYKQKIVRLQKKIITNPQEQAQLSKETTKYEIYDTDGNLLWHIGCDRLKYYKSKNLITYSEESQKYIYSMSVKKKTKLCNNYFSWNCDLGEKCSYAHSLEELCKVDEKKKNYFECNICRGYDNNSNGESFISNLFDGALLCSTCLNKLFDEYKNIIGNCYKKIYDYKLSIVLDFNNIPENIVEEKLAQSINTLNSTGYVYNKYNDDMHDIQKMKKYMNGTINHMSKNNSCKFRDYCYSIEFVNQYFQEMGIDKKIYLDSDINRDATREILPYLRNKFYNRSSK